ncbi:MAG: carbohydrate kinase family protein [Pseudoclavibacter sp.]|nr:carbohydrate kinase family protein [Pseudoclavibacter sp.]
MPQTGEPAEARDPVVVIGDARVQELLDRGGRSRTRSVGGPGANIAGNLALLGVPCVLLASLGRDAAGRRVRETLEELGVEVLASASRHGTGRAASMAGPAGVSTVYDRACRDRAVAFDEAQRERIDRAPLVIVSGFPFDRPGQHRRLLDAVAQPQNRLVLDPNPRAGLLRDAEAFRRNAGRHASSALLVHLSERDAPLLAPAPAQGAPTSAERLLAAGAAHVLASAGPGPARWLGRSGIDVALPAPRLPGPVVDPLGAGDALVAAVAAGLLRTPRPLWPQRARSILAAAMSLAGATVRQRGPCLQDADELPVPARGLLGRR